MPRTGLDLNADGYTDYIASANGEGIEVFLGGEEGPFNKRTALQKLPSAGIIQSDDVNGDSLADFVLYDPQLVDGVVRLGLNTGSLPAAGP